MPSDGENRSLMIYRRTRADRSRDNTYAEESVIDAPNPTIGLVAAGRIDHDRLRVARAALPAQRGLTLQPLIGAQVGDPGVDAAAPAERWRCGRDRRGERCEHQDGGQPGTDETESLAVTCHGSSLRCVTGFAPRR